MLLFCCISLTQIKITFAVPVFSITKLQQYCIPIFAQAYLLLLNGNIIKGKHTGIMLLSILGLFEFKINVSKFQFNVVSRNLDFLIHFLKYFIERFQHLPRLNFLLYRSTSLPDLVASDDLEHGHDISNCSTRGVVWFTNMQY